LHASAHACVGRRARLRQIGFAGQPAPALVVPNVLAHFPHFMETVDLEHFAGRSVHRRLSRAGSFR
jgi:hypothetical protein